MMATGMEGAGKRGERGNRQGVQREGKREKENDGRMQVRVGQGWLVAHAQNLARETKNGRERNNQGRDTKRLKERQQRVREKLRGKRARVKERAEEGERDRT